MGWAIIVRTLMSRRGGVQRAWYGAVTWAPLILILALLPSTLYIDHWAEYLGAVLSSSPVEEVGRAEHVSHHAHCHAGPGTCSDQATAPGSQLFPQIIELSEPDFPTVLVESSTATLAAAIVRVPKEPPRA